MVAPNTASPGPLSTGIDSPVSMLSSNEDPPSTMVPSVGTFSPGLTTIRSPTETSSIGVATSTPSRSTEACLAPISSNPAIACDARPLDLASRNLPSRMKVMIHPAVSKKTGCSVKKAHTE